MITESAAELRIRSCSAQDAERWDHFVSRNPLTTFFHRFGWRSLLEEQFGYKTHYLLAERAGDVVGVLPLAEVKSAIAGHSLISIPFAVYGGAVAEDSSGVEALHDAAVSLTSRLGAARLELRNRSMTQASWPRQDLYVTFRREISADPDANFKAIPRKQRAMVRKAMDRGLTSRIDGDASVFYSLYAGNQHRHGSPAHSRRYFAALRRAFGDDCEILTVLDPGGTPVSSVLSFYFKGEVLPYYAGDAVAARALAANDFKYWELMRLATERGLRVFDFGRSKRDTGSFSFKKNWGFDPTPLHYEFHLANETSIPQNNPSNPKYRALIGTWRRLPRPIVDFLGPRVIRHFG